MWFRMAPGAERITVERQEFNAEAHGSNGEKFFRAPAHFAPKITAIAGFTLAIDVPEDAPADLPKEDPSRDDAIGNLTASFDAQRTEISGLRSDLMALSAEHSALVLAKEAVEAKLAEALAKIEELGEELEDRPIAPVKGKAA